MGKKKTSEGQVSKDKKALTEAAETWAERAVDDYYGIYQRGMELLLGLRSDTNSQLTKLRKQMAFLLPRAMSLPLIDDLPDEGEWFLERSNPKRKKAKKKAAKKKSSAKKTSATKKPAKKKAAKSGGTRELKMSDRVKAYLGRKPKAGPAEIHKALGRHGVTVSLASVIKSRMKKAGQLK